MAKKNTLRMDGGRLTLADLAAIADREVNLALTADARKAVRRARKVVDGFIDRDEVAYGITTGFGRFCRVRISPDQARELQRNLLRSHGAGVGEPFAPEVARLCVALRANTLAQGHSGIGLPTLELLLAIYNEDIVPWIPSQGSVGACGDLAPLAHLAQVLIGEGRAFVDGAWISGGEALERRGLRPVELQAKEGLSLINGVQASAALLAVALIRARRLLAAANFAAAMSLDALLGSLMAFDARVQRVRPHAGQEVVAQRVRSLLAGSAIHRSHRDCGKVQDAYSLRCVPQVHGAVHDGLAYVEQVLVRECNSATDNPLVFPEEGEIVSGGNFHGAPVSYVADLLSILITDLASISERRIERLVNPDLSGLPAFLSRSEGLESGYMMAQVTAAALTSENKVLAHPASVDSIPTSAGTEDHVSMSTHAGRKALQVVGNAERVLAIELLVGADALELRRPLRSGAKLERGLAQFRNEIPARVGDRDLNGEIEGAARFIRVGGLEP
ncbi:MAG: histidine ammonia-lyase [Planctomycetota bacterium]